MNTAYVSVLCATRLYVLPELISQNRRRSNHVVAEHLHSGELRPEWALFYREIGGRKDDALGATDAEALLVREKVESPREYHTRKHANSRPGGCTQRQTGVTRKGSVWGGKL